MLMVCQEMAIIVVTHFTDHLTDVFTLDLKMFLNYLHTHRMIHRMDLMDFRFSDSNHHQFVHVYVDSIEILTLDFTVMIYN